MRFIVNYKDEIPSMLRVLKVGHGLTMEINVQFNLIMHMTSMNLSE